MLELRHLAFDCYLSLKEFTNSVSNDVRYTTTIKTYQTPWEEISFDSKFILLSLTTNRQIILSAEEKSRKNKQRDWFIVREQVDVAWYVRSDWSDAELLWRQVLCGQVGLCKLRSWRFTRGNRPIEVTIF